MKVIDIEGRELEVADLHLALLQADDYRHYRVSAPSAQQLYLYRYWEHLYQQLLVLWQQVHRGDTSTDPK